MRVVTTLLYGHPMEALPAIEVEGEVALRRLERSDLGELRGVWDLTDEKLAQFDRRYEGGRSCWLTTLDGVPAHYAWVQTEGGHPVHSLARTVPVEDGEAWIFDCRTAESARRRGLYSWTLTQLVERLAAQERRSVKIYTTIDNVPSRRGIARAGFERFQICTLLSWGPIRLRLPRRLGAVPGVTPEAPGG